MIQSNDEAQKFLNHMIDSYPQVHNSRYWKEIDPFIGKLATGQCLDLGCGPGLLLLDLYNRYKSTKLIGIDLSPIMLEKASEFFENLKETVEIKLKQQHLQNDMELPQNNQLIFSSRVLRSFEEPLQILSSIHNSLSEDGLLVLLDWDQQPIRVYQKWFKENPRFRDHNIHDIVRLHRNFSRYSLDDWVILLETSNFVIEHTFQLDPVHIVIVAKKIME